MTFTYAFATTGGSCANISCPDLMRKVAEHVEKELLGDEAAVYRSPKADGVLTFDKLTNVFQSGTKHDEDQPSHLLVSDTSVCATRCREEYGNPCQHFCPANVYEMVVAGNATMLHLLLGVDAHAVSVAPFVPAFPEPLDLPAAALGVNIHPEGRIQILPSFGAYVGADIVAGIQATGLTREPELRLFVDVGTNGEIVLGNADRVLATASPAGPAFEGGHVKAGMRAADGAIEGVDLADGEVRLPVIGNVAPLGLCGSGLIDVVAQLRLVLRGLAPPFRYSGQAAAYAAVAAVIGIFATQPAYTYLPRDHALLKLRFSHAGQPLKPCRRYTHEELTSTPFSERKATSCERGRWPVYVELDLDGKALYRGTHEPAGLWNDGPSSVYARFEVPAGRHRLDARLRDSGAQTGFGYTGTQTVELEPGENFVVDFRAANGGFSCDPPAPAGPGRGAP